MSRINATFFPCVTMRRIPNDLSNTHVVMNTTCLYLSPPFHIFDLKSPFFGVVVYIIAVRHYIIRININDVTMALGILPRATADSGHIRAWPKAAHCA